MSCSVKAGMTYIFLARLKLILYVLKQIVKIAFERVKTNKGTYGIDEQNIANFEGNQKR